MQGGSFFVYYGTIQGRPFHNKVHPLLKAVPFHFPRQAQDKKADTANYDKHGRYKDGLGKRSILHAKANDENDRAGNRYRELGDIQQKSIKIVKTLYEIKNGKYRERSVAIFYGDYESKFGSIGK